MITSNGQVPVATDGDDEPVGPGRVTGKQLLELVADDAWLDDLIDSAQQGGVQLTGQGGFLPEMIKAVLARTPAVFMSITGGGDVKVTRRLSSSAG